MLRGRKHRLFNLIQKAKTEVEGPRLALIAAHRPPDGPSRRTTQTTLTQRKNGLEATQLASRLG